MTHEKALHVLMLPSWYHTPDRPWHGIFFENQALALARAGARVGVAFAEMRSLRTLSPAAMGQSYFQTISDEDRGVTNLRLKSWNPMAQTPPGARIWCALSRRLVRIYARRFGIPDVIHAQAAHWAGRVAVDSAKAFARPSVVTEHSTAVLRGALRADERRHAIEIYRDADAVLAVSRALADVVDSLAGTHRCQVLPNFIDFQFFTLPPVPRRQAPFTFLCVCNLINMHKRVDRLIRAFARVCAMRPESRLVVVGEGPDETALRILARECGVSPQVEFTGGLNATGVRERMWQANAFVLPSAFETFGVVFVEALATGIPVISTRSGGPEEFIEPDLGALVDQDDEAGLADAMEAVASRTFSEQCLRDRAAGQFSFETLAQGLLGVYDRLGAAHRPQAKPLS
jgi:glycosyltransferase involved in cell wall biosynthesis